MREAKKMTSDIMLHKWRQWLICLSGILLFQNSVLAGPLELHPLGKPMPTSQQGPFVTTADGGILCVDAHHAHHSTDGGKTWSKTPLFIDDQKYKVSNERALLRTREGVVIAAWMNLAEMKSLPGFKWNGPPEEFAQYILPTYVCRSLDDGKTWEEPILLHRPWCGCIHSMIQIQSGRIVLVGQTIIPEWRHATVMFVSDDQGKTWKSSNILDYGVGNHDHAGSCEATVIERADGSLYQLLRTESGYFFEAESFDEGLTWGNLQRSKVPSVTCCGQMARLSDGRVALLWNHPLRSQPKNGSSREELSIAFSNDDGKTWTDRTVIATRYHRPGDRYFDTWVSYPYLYERVPGELWITTMQGGLRMQIATKDITKVELPVPENVVFLGDSTTAYRRGQITRVASDHVSEAFAKVKAPYAVLNRGVPGSTSRAALSLLNAEIDHWNAKLVVVQLGINDSVYDVWKNPPATAPRVSLEEYKKNMRQIVTKIQDHGAKVILMTTNPLRWTEKYLELYGKSHYDPANPVSMDEGLAEYNTAVRELAKELNLPLVDIHGVYNQQEKAGEIKVDALLLDGVHPNDAGQKLTSEQVLPVIREVLSLQ